jgi:hypothetical protein
MTFRIAVFSITFLANMNFDRESFQETILNTIGSMGYSTERQCPWGSYEPGYKHKHLFNEDVIEKYFKGKDLFKYVLFVDDLRCFLNNSYAINEFEIECQDIYRSLYFALISRFPDIHIMTFGIPEETTLYLDKF